MPAFPADFSPESVLTMVQPQDPDLFAPALVWIAILIGVIWYQMKRAKPGKDTDDDDYFNRQW